MIVTKLLGLTAFLTKSKKAKLIVLGIEMAVLGYALIAQRQEKKRDKNNRLYANESDNDNNQQLYS